MNLDFSLNSLLFIRSLDIAGLNAFDCIQLGGFEMHGKIDSAKGTCTQTSFAIASLL